MTQRRPYAESAAATRLTPRQRDVLYLLSFRLTNAEIAAVLNLSQRTVECHVASILAALHVANRREAAAVAMLERETRAAATALLRSTVALPTVPTTLRNSGDEIRQNY